MPHRLAIDVGSSSVKIHAGSLTDGELTFEPVTRLDNETTWEDDRHVWDIPALTAGLREGIASASEEYGDIVSVGIDSTALDFGLLADGELVRNPYFYRDPSLWSELDRTTDRCSERRAFHLTGYNGAPGPIHYQYNEAPELFEDADTIVPLPQLLGHQLGGTAETERSYAMTFQVFDIRSGTWADELIDVLGLPRNLFADPVPAGTVAGSVDPTGPDGIEPDIVLPPSHDTASAVGALPLTEENNAWLCTGSWFIPGLELPDPIVTDEVYDAGGSNEVGVEDRIRFMRNLPGFSLLEHCRDEWREAGKTYEYEPLLDRVEEPDADVPVIDIRSDAFLDAQFDGDVQTRVREVCERTGQTPPDDEFETTNCLLVSLAAGSALVLDRLLSVADERVDRVHLGGGGVRNEPFCQLFASAMGRPVHAGPTEATALGNLLVQLRTGGEISDIEAGRELVAEQFPVTEYDPQNQATWATIRERIESLDA